MTTDLREKIAEVLAGHDVAMTRDRYLVCFCEEWRVVTTGGPLDAEVGAYREHVAEAILAAIGDRVLPEDTDEHRQLGRRMPNGLVIASSLPDPTHYRLVGPWLPVDTEDPRRALTEEAPMADG